LQIQLQRKRLGEDEREIREQKGKKENEKN